MSSHNAPHTNPLQQTTRCNTDPKRISTMQAQQPEGQLEAS